MTIVDNDFPSQTDYRAILEQTLYGTVTNSYEATLESDNSYEEIKEVLSTERQAVRRTSRLEHRWEFAVEGTNSGVFTFHVEAHRSANSEGDNFVFAYSEDGVSYTDMVTVDTTGDVAKTFSLPTDLSGTLYVRVRDTNRSSGKTALDTVYVDDMFIRWESASAAVVGQTVGPANRALTLLPRGNGSADKMQSTDEAAAKPDDLNIVLEAADTTMYVSSSSSTDAAVQTEAQAAAVVADAAMENLEVGPLDEQLVDELAIALL